MPKPLTGEALAGFLSGASPAPAPGAPRDRFRLPAGAPPAIGLTELQQDAFTDTRQHRRQPRRRSLRTMIGTKVLLSVPSVEIVCAAAAAG